MGKHVKVRYNPDLDENGDFESEDWFNPGQVMDAYIPSKDEVDCDGLKVAYLDEVWIESEHVDISEHVICQLSDGFEIVH